MLQKKIIFIIKDENTVLLVKVQRYYWRLKKLWEKTKSSDSVARFSSNCRIKKKKTQQKIEFLQGLEMLSERIIYREEETESF